MRLHTKFLLLIFGSVVVPVLVMSLFLFREISDPTGRLPPHQLVRLRRSLLEIEEQSGTPDDIAAVIHSIAPLAEVLILDSSGIIEYSSVEVDSILAFLQMDGAFEFSHIKSSTLTLSIMMAFPMLHPPGSRAGYSMLIFLGSILTFMIVMSVVIIRSINRSISGLEEATRKISAGDLDFRLDAKGNDRIASLTRSFEAMRRRVQEETAARSRFLMAVSHDLKTPLSSITGYLDALQEGMAENPAQQEKYLGIIRDKTNVLENRIRQLIDFVKLETTGWHSPQEVLLAPFLEEAATVFAAEAEARGVAFSRDIQLARSLQISMDGDLVFRVLENLIQNAFHYADEQARIEIGAVQNDINISVHICNSGSIAPEDLPLIFEPFYRGSKSRSETGFGLGLSVVKSVIVSHGWEIEVDSKDGRTCFTVIIPLEPRKNGH